MASNALDAWDVTALRFGVAGLLLLPLFARRRLGALRPLRALFLACGAGAPYVLLTAGGLAFAPGGHMGVITPSCMLLCSTLGSRLILKEPLTAKPHRRRARDHGRARRARLGRARQPRRSHVARRLDVRARRPVLGELHDRLARLARRAAARDGRRRRAVDGALHSGLRLARGQRISRRRRGARSSFRPCSKECCRRSSRCCSTRARSRSWARRAARCSRRSCRRSRCCSRSRCLHETPTELQLVGVAFVTAGMVFALGLHDPAKWRSLPTRATPR